MSGVRKLASLVVLAVALSGGAMLGEPAETRAATAPWRLAFATEVAGRRGLDVYVVDVPGGTPRRVAGLPGVNDFSPAWSPDGRALLVQRTEKQVTDLRLIAVDGGEVRRIPLGAELTKLLASGRGGPRPALREIVWSPDGRQLALVLSASRIETLVLENPLALAGAQDGRR